MKKSILPLLLFMVFGINGFGQTDKQLEDIRKAQAKEFEKFVQSIEQENSRYNDSINREFSVYLREIWPKFNLESGIKSDSIPKPKALPRYVPPIEKLKQKSIPIKIFDTEPSAISNPILVPLPALIPYQEPVKEEITSQKAAVDFYGAKVDVYFNPEIVYEIPKEIHNTTVADFWDRMNKVNPSGLIYQMNDFKSRMNLNDWGFYMLVRKTVENISPDTNYSRLLTWYILTKSGYRIRVAHSNNKLVIMFPSSSPIYNIRYFVNNDVKFYAPGYTMNTIYTYEKDFPGSTKIFDMNIFSPPNIGDLYNEKLIKFTYQGKEYNLAMSYNINAVNFYKDYPQCNLRVYFDAVATPASKESVLNALKPCIKGMSLRESVEFLLNFVQNGFAYKTDPEQFGFEKFDFPEEILHYPYSDCDDRAVFFSYLVKELTGLKVIGVLYPGHVATAVNFPDDEAGDFILYKGEKYIIADPTYIDAPVGLTMPGKVNSQAHVLEMLNKHGSGIEIATVWEKTMAGGGYPGDNQMNAVTDQEGNTYITGYFKGKLLLGETNFYIDDSTDNVFIAKYDRSGNVVWAKRSTDKAKGRGYNINMDNEGNLYVCGTFENLMAFGSFNIVFATREKGLFLLKLNKGGEAAWLRQIDFKTDGAGTGMILFSEFNTGGELLKKEILPYDPGFTGYGITFDQPGNIYYSTPYSTTLGLRMDRIELGLGANFDVVLALKDETDKQISANCETTIAGLFAVINLIRLDNVTLSGKTVQQAMAKYNPRFITNSAKIYECIGKLTFLKNNAGIITIQTEDHKSVMLEGLRINDGTRIRIIFLPGGDARIDILGGVKVGKAVIWYDLNFIRLFRTDGNLTFDYDTDHSQKTMNLRKDLLN